jgi:hypothetical protein
LTIRTIGDITKKGFSGKNEIENTEHHPCDDFPFPHLVKRTKRQKNYGPKIVLLANKKKR